MNYVILFSKCNNLLTSHHSAYSTSSSQATTGTSAQLFYSTRFCWGRPSDTPLQIERLIILILNSWCKLNSTNSTSFLFYYWHGFCENQCKRWWRGWWRKLEEIFHISKNERFAAETFTATIAPSEDEKLIKVLALEEWRGQGGTYLINL